MARRRRSTRKGGIRKTRAAGRRAYEPARRSRRSPARRRNTMGGQVRVELISGAAGAGVGIVAAETIEETTGNAWGGLVVAAVGLWVGRQARGAAIKSFGGGMAIGSAGMTVANLVEAPVRQLIAPLVSGLLPEPTPNPDDD